MSGENKIATGGDANAAGDRSDTSVDKYIAELNATGSALAASFDKTLTTIAAGSFAISITFIKELAPQPVNRERLYVAWIAFAASLLTILSGFLLAQIAAGRQAELWLNGTTFDIANRSRHRWNRIIVSLNTTSLALLMVGVVALIAFAKVNFGAAPTAATRSDYIRARTK